MSVSFHQLLNSYVSNSHEELEFPEKILDFGHSLEGGNAMCCADYQSISTV
jgi:hypothetical protein